MTELNNEQKDVTAEHDEVGSLLDHVKSFLERLRGGQKARDEPLSSGFKSIGNHRWVGWFSNNFEDYQKEFFPARATDEFIARLDRKEVPMPELYFWHVPFRFGEAKSVARISLDDSPNSPSFTIAVGDYDDTPIARAFEKAIGQREYPMSHGFQYPPVAKIDGAYHYYDTFEVSPLPPYAPANPFTLFEDKEMPVLDDNKRKELVVLLGEDYVKDIETKAETRLKELKQEGVAYKGMPIVDAEARAQLEQLSKQMGELTEAVKAKMPKPDDDEDADAKKKRADENDAFKKEVGDAIKQLAAHQTQMAQNLKDFLDLTPRRASKSSATLVDPNDQALIELKQGATGEKSNEDKIFTAAFGSILGGLQNGS